jgi:hypothetical protein
MANNRTENHESELRDDSSRGYEIRDIHMSVVVIGVSALAILCVVALALMWWLVEALDRIPGERAAEAPVLDYGRLLPPEPRLQADPPRDLEEFLASEDEFLTTYGWINREEGVVRIPIDRAMELVAERGLPEWEDPNAPGATPSEGTAVNGEIAPAVPEEPSPVESEQ